ncbi:MAG TPA: peroxiredoxin family protein, partial [Anaerolineae bacterium]|nr:peroxiredoxin family protein [Anaerolineae bacterium]
EVAQLKEKVRVGTIIPFFNLPSARGGNVRTWDYKQRKHLALYFFGRAVCVECRKVLKEFTENYDNYRRLNAEVLAVGIGDISELTKLANELDLPFPVLSDATGEVTNKYTYINPETNLPYPSVFLADKFGSLEEEWIVTSEDELPGQDELLSILQLFELRCPE